MEDEINGAVPCSSLAVDSILRVGTAGAIWGLCMGPYDARKQGLSGVTRASFVAKAVGKFGFQYGLVAGIYMITRCGIQRYRRQNDWAKVAIVPGLVSLIVGVICNGSGGMGVGF
ncbi:outer envelope pore protein 16-4, chloroplastic isoform X1 [Quercus suber]|uniref:outer envelope pore protein 16-4, chloroplastic isoform X1 n=1 Tax=Quercus suber TaxID=58331 RepID=UPI0032DF2CFD